MQKSINKTNATFKETTLAAYEKFVHYYAATFLDNIFYDIAATDCDPDYEPYITGEAYETLQQMFVHSMLSLNVCSHAGQLLQKAKHQICKDFESIITDEVDIDQFIKFSAKKYHEILLDGITYILYEYFSGEYDEDAVVNIPLLSDTSESLKYIKQMMLELDSIYDFLYIKCGRKSFKFLDENKKNITKKCFKALPKEFIKEMKKQKAGMANILINTLIRLAPRNIVFLKEEKFKDQKAIDIIKAIFKEK